MSCRRSVEWPPARPAASVMIFPELEMSDGDDTWQRVADIEVVADTWKVCLITVV